MQQAPDGDEHKRERVSFSVPTCVSEGEGPNKASGGKTTASHRKRAATDGHQFEQDLLQNGWSTQEEDNKTQSPFCSDADPEAQEKHETVTGHIKDSRRAWLTIASTCFMAYGTVYGTTYTFPVLYTALEHLYGNSSDHGHSELISFRISWIGSACFGMSNFLCLFSSLLTDMVSTQLLLLIGACAGALGIVASSFVQQLELWYFTYVCITGMGNACIYLAVVTVLSDNFDRDFPLANGVTSLGSGVMQTLFPFIWQYLLHEFGLNAMLYFMAGSYASLVLYIPFWRSPGAPWFTIRRIDPNVQRPDCRTKNAAGVGRQSQTQPRATNGDDSKLLVQPKSDAQTWDSAGQTLHASLMQLPSAAARRMRDDLQHNAPLSPLTKPLSISLITSISSESEAETVDTLQKTSSRCDFCKLHIFRNKRYVIFLIGMLLYQIGTAAPDMFIVSYTDDKFHTSGMSSLVPLISYSITICVAKIVFSKLLGTFSNNLAVSMLVFQLGPCLNGITMSLIPIFVSRLNSYPLMVFTCILWGLSDGPPDALLAPVIRLLVGPAHMGRAVGYCVAICMTSSMLGPPLAGLILDTLRTYDITFYISGTLIFLGTCTFFLVSFVRDEPATPPATPECSPIIMVEHTVVDLKPPCDTSASSKQFDNEKANYGNTDPIKPANDATSTVVLAGSASASSSAYSSATATFGSVPNVLC